MVKPTLRGSTLVNQLNETIWVNNEHCILNATMLSSTGQRENYSTAFSILFNGSINMLILSSAILEKKKVEFTKTLMTHTKFQSEEVSEI